MFESIIQRLNQNKNHDSIVSIDIGISLTWEGKNKMLPIKPNHFEFEDNISDYFFTNQKEIVLKIEEAFRFCDENNISIGYKNIYGVIEQNEIKMYCNYILVYRNSIKDGFSSVPFEEAFSSDAKPEEREKLERSLVAMLITCFYLAYSIRTSKIKVKRASAKFYTIHKIAHSNGIVAKEYVNSGELYIVEEKDQKVSFLSNGPGKKNFTVPSSLYKMPNKGKVRCFHPGNMKILDDNAKLDILLNGFEYNLGKCYSNAEKMRDVLEGAGYTREHTVEYFAGWLFMYGSNTLHHHAWIVVNSESVIDLTVKHSDQFSQCLALLEEGKKAPFTRDKIAQWAFSEMKESVPFSRYHYYGKVKPSLYIGVKCTPQEAKDSFAELLASGKLPGYEHFDKGENKLQKLYREKFGG